MKVEITEKAKGFIKKKADTITIRMAEIGGG